jgi:hypothetical protein
LKAPSPPAPGRRPPGRWARDFGVGPGRHVLGPSRVQRAAGTLLLLPNAALRCEVSARMMDESLLRTVASPAPSQRVHWQPNERDSRQQHITESIGYTRKVAKQRATATERRTSRSRVHSRRRSRRAWSRSTSAARAADCPGPCVPHECTVRAHGGHGRSWCKALWVLLVVCTAAMCDVRQRRPGVLFSGGPPTDLHKKGLQFFHAIFRTQPAQTRESNGDRRAVLHSHSACTSNERRACSGSADGAVSCQGGSSAVYRLHRRRQRRGQTTPTAA